MIEFWPFPPTGISLAGSSETSMKPSTWTNKGIRPPRAIQLDSANTEVGGVGVVDESVWGFVVHGHGAGQPRHRGHDLYRVVQVETDALDLSQLAIGIEQEAVLQGSCTTTDTSYTILQYPNTPDC